jgi:hypothetical protein
MRGLPYRCRLASNNARINTCGCQKLDPPFEWPINAPAGNFWKLPAVVKLSRL